MKTSILNTSVSIFTSQPLFLVLLLLLPLAGQAQTTYTWTGGDANVLLDNSSVTPANRDNISRPNNWSPRRAAASPTDILIFDGATVPAPVVSIYNEFTVGQLRFINGVNAMLVATNEDKIVTINGPAGGGQGLLLAATSSVLMTSEAGANFEIQLALVSSATAVIGGTLTMSGASASTLSRQRLQGLAASAFVFQSGSFLRVRAGIAGDISEGVPGSIIMQAGATYVQEGGSDPFNSTDVISEITKFRAGSTYRYVGQPGQPNRFPNDAHQYGNLVFDVPAGSGYNISVTGTPLSILNDLTLTASNTANVSIGSDNTRLGGNLLVQPGTSTILNFNGGTDHRLSFVGSTAQTLSAPAGQLLMGTTALPTELEINNTTGVTLGLPLTLNGKLVLTSGYLTTTATNLLTLTVPPDFNGAADANVPVQNNSFVNGPLARVLNGIQSNTVLFFPLGKTPTSNNAFAAYRPLRLTLTQATGTATYTAEQFEQVPTPRTLPGSLVRVSRVRYFHVSRTGTSVLSAGRVMLGYGSDDFVTNASTLRLAQSNSTTDSWQNIGGTGTSVPASSTSVQPVRASIESALVLSASTTMAVDNDFALASATANTNPLANAVTAPLPVTLTSFDAEPKNEAVEVSWTTASEKNSAYFEVQRSVDGVEFQTLTTIAGQGTSNALQQYAWQDTQPAAGPNYYRLRQVDIDNEAQLSLVRTVEWTAAAGTPFVVYPTVLNEGPLHYKYAGQLPDNATLRVYSSTGQQLLAQPATTGQLDLPALATGWYQVQLTAGSRHFAARFYQP